MNNPRFAAGAGSLWAVVLLGGCVSPFDTPSDQDIGSIERRALARARSKESENAKVASAMKPAPGSAAEAAQVGGMRRRPVVAMLEAAAATLDPAEPQPDPNMPRLRPGGIAQSLEAAYTLPQIRTDGPMLRAFRFPVVRLSLQDAIRRAVANSHQIRAAGFEPSIRATDILEAEGAFDTILFFRGDGVDENNGFSGVLYRNRALVPGTGGALGAAGGASPGAAGTAAASVSKELGYRFGARQLLPTGGTVEVSQRMTHNESDSLFLVPNPQSFTGLSLSVVQPLLRGAGLDYNRARIFIGTNNKELGIQEFRRQVIIQLANVEQAYWNLNLSRYLLAVQERLLSQQVRVYDMLAARRDVLPFALDRARAAVETTKANIVQAQVNLRDNQDRLKVLINDPELPLRQEVEIIPADPVANIDTPTDAAVREASLMAALANRPEVLQARLNIKNAAVQEGITRNELLPRLDLLAETIPQGLQHQISTALRDEFAFKFQDWVFGIAFEVPVGNRAARARHRRQTLLREQSIETLSNSIQNVYFEVTTALHALENTRAQNEARNRSLEAAAAEYAGRLARLGNRDDGPIPTQLDLLLQSLDRVAQAATQLYQNQVESINGITNLERAKGTLLFYNNIDVDEDLFRQKTPAAFEPRNVVPAPPKANR